jgi:CBS domain-containing protein
LTYVEPDASLIEVKTLMVARDFSQIPVLSKDRRNLKGSVTWKSLARFRTEGMSVAREVMVHGGHTAKLGDPLMDHIRNIIHDEFIYVRNDQNQYVAVVTTTDLAQSFSEVSGPFMNLREIEMRIRVLIDRLPIELVRSTVEPLLEPREINSAADLMFGQYVMVLESEQNWTAIGLPFDRKTIVKNLREVNTVRNKIMHFRPEPLKLSESIVVDSCLNWLRECFTDSSHAASMSFE